MGDVVNLQPAALIENQEFISDMCRFSEGIVSEKALRKKYRLAESDWEKLNDDTLVRAIEAESIRRVRDGSCKRERAQLLVVKAPEVAASIMNDVEANAKHRLDACKVLDDFSANGPQGTPASDRFQIVINLGADLDGKPIVEKYDRSVAIDVNDRDPHHIDDRVFPAIVTKKITESGSDEPV